jgi:hypothetical protein
MNTVDKIIYLIHKYGEVMESIQGQDPSSGIFEEMECEFEKQLYKLIDDLHLEKDVSDDLKKVLKFMGVCRELMTDWAKNEQLQNIRIMLNQ